MNNTAKLEAYLSGALQPEDRLLMEAHLLINPELKEDLQWQKSAYTLIQEYSRKQIKAEIEAVHKKLFSEKKFESFRAKIISIFKK